MTLHTCYLVPDQVPSLLVKNRHQPQFPIYLKLLGGYKYLPPPPSPSSSFSLLQHSGPTLHIVFLLSTLLFF